MKFADIIKTNSWLSVEIVFLQLYPDEKNIISEYEKIYNDLCLLKPTDTDISIVVRCEIDDYDKHEYVDVSGYYNDPQKSVNDYTNSLALEFTSWNKWLGMDFDKNSLRDFSELELICHCLFEMTFFSFEQEDIEKELNRINGIVDEIENMTEDEKKKKLIPFDEMKKRLKNKGK
jgi:hypothetical protein